MLYKFVAELAVEVFGLGSSAPASILQTDNTNHFKLLGLTMQLARYLNCM